MCIFIRSLLHSQFCIVLAAKLEVHLTHEKEKRQDPNPRDLLFLEIKM
jgi:hypothetical protein